MIFKRAYKYKLKPTRQQLLVLFQFAGARRYIYNRGLSERQKAYEATGKTLSYFDQNKELTILKEQSDTPWLSDIHSQVLQQSLKDLDRAFTNFFRRVKQGQPPGFPRFKKKGQGESFRFPQGVKVEGTQVYLPKIGWVKFRKSRDLQGAIQETTILQEGKDWYISFSCEIEAPTPHLPPLMKREPLASTSASPTLPPPLLPAKIPSSISKTPGFYKNTSNDSATSPVNSPKKSKRAKAASKPDFNSPSCMLVLRI